MKPTKNLQGTCGVCGAPIEFPAERIGLADQCPHCGKQTELSLAQPPEEPAIPRKVLFLTAGTILLLVFSLIACVVSLKHFQKLDEQKRQQKQHSSATPPSTGTNTQ